MNKLTSYRILRVWYISDLINKYIYKYMSFYKPLRSFAASTKFFHLFLLSASCILAVSFTWFKFVYTRSNQSRRDLSLEHVLLRFVTSTSLIRLSLSLHMWPDHSSVCETIHFSILGPLKSLSISILIVRCSYCLVSML